MSRKRVLYIGDSISCAVRRVATSLAKEKMLFDGFGTSKAVDNLYFKDAIKNFAKHESRRDVVIFNNGLHGWRLDDAEYKYHYEEMVKFLLTEFKATSIFIVLTTHVNNKERDTHVVNKNKVAKELACKYGLSIIDLYTLTLESSELLSDDGVHFKDEGYKLIAEKIIQSIMKYFPEIKM